MIKIQTTVNRTKYKDSIILAFLALGTLALRYMTLMEVNVGGDNIDYWYYGKSILYDYPYDLYFHRSVRWGIILPTVLVQFVFGIRAWVIYLTPVLMTVLLNYSVFLVGRKLFSKKTAYLSIIVIQFFPYMIRMGSQLFLGVFSMNYILLSLFFLLKYLDTSCEDEGKKEAFWFFLSILFMFLSYLTKITNLYFLFPYLIILGRRKGLKRVLSYGAILFFFYLCEHLSYFLLLDEPLGRLGIITSTHLGNSTMELNRGHADGTFLGLFRRYDFTHFPIYWHIILWGGLASGVLLLKRSQKEQTQESIRLGRSVSELLLIIAFFFIFITFGVKGLNPITPFENYHPRYFSSVLPFLAFFICHLLGDIGTPLVKKVPFLVRPNWPIYLFSLPLLGILSLSVLTAYLPKSASSYLNNPFRWGDHILSKVINWDRQINSGVSENALLRCWIDGPEDTPEKRNSKKSLDTVNRLYLNLERGVGSFPEEFFTNEDGTQFKWINYKADAVSFESYVTEYNFLREPFELEIVGQ